MAETVSGKFEPIARRKVRRRKKDTTNKVISLRGEKTSLTRSGRRAPITSDERADGTIESSSTLKV